MTTRSIPFISTSPRASFQVALRQAWNGVGAMVKARATRRLLLEMEPRMLADIGVGRGEAMHEASRPFWDVQPRR